MLRRLLSLCLALSLGFAPSLGFAAKRGDRAAQAAALVLFKQGRMALQAKDFDAALKLFRQAQATYEHEPLIVLALAKTLDGAGQREKALRYYEIFIKQVEPTDRDRAPTLKRIAALKKELATRPATIVLKGLPTGAQVWLDGKATQVGVNNTLTVPAGVHGVRVAMGNRVPYARSGMALGPGQRLELDVVLLEPVDESKLSRDHTWTWVAGGLTAAAALGAGVLAVRGVSLRNSYGELADLQTGKITAAARKRYNCVSQKAEDCPELITEANQRRAAIDSNDSLLYGVGIGVGVLGLATLVAYLAAPVKRPARGAGLLLTPMVDGRRAGVMATLRF